MNRADRRALAFGRAFSPSRSYYQPTGWTGPYLREQTRELYYEEVGRDFVRTSDDLVLVWRYTH